MPLRRLFPVLLSASILFASCGGGGGSDRAFVAVAVTSIELDLDDSCGLNWDFSVELRQDGYLYDWDSEQIVGSLEKDGTFSIPHYDWGGAYWLELNGMFNGNSGSGQYIEHTYSDGMTCSGTWSGMKIILE